MEFMSLTMFIKYGTPLTLMALVILITVLSIQVNSLTKRFDRMEGNITWKDTCKEKHTAIDKRLDRLEYAANGRKD